MPNLIGNSLHHVQEEAPRAVYFLSAADSEPAVTLQTSEVSRVGDIAESAFQRAFLAYLSAGGFY